jgi:uncharacterized membrane protein YgcG
MTDGIITVVDPEGDDTDVEPVPFRINHRDPDGGRADSDFRALGRIPYAWAAELLASGAYSPAVQCDALLAFFRRVLVDEDRDRFFKLANDPKVLIQATTLQSTAEILLDRYLGVDPTKARGSGGQRRSRSGRTSTGRGSSGGSRAKASTSR